MKLDDYEINELMLQQAVVRGARKAHRSRAAGRVALILAATLLVSAGALAAAGRFSGSIDWFGRPHTESAPTPAPTFLPQEQEKEMELSYRADELIEARPEGEYWIAQHGRSASHGVPFEALTSLDQAEARIHASGMKMPVEIPDGFTLDDSEMQFYFTEQDFRDTRLIDMEETPEGILIKKYRTGPDVKNHVQNYFFRFRDAQGRYLYINGDLADPNGEHSFGIDETTVYETLNIPGMANALYTERTVDNRRALYLLEKNLPARDFLIFRDFEDEYPESAQYTSAVYVLASNILGKEELIAIAQSMK